MDLDPAGADISGESQLDIDPSSGLDPTRQVKYVPTAATSIYPNVTQPLLAPVTSAGDQQVAPPTPKALQGIPVVGQNVPSAPVDLSPPNAVNLSMSATGRSGNPLVMQAGTGATQITQTNQPPATPTVPMPRPRPEAAGPGASQLVPRGTGTGPMGTDETMVAPYNPQRGNLETAKANLQAMAERQEQYARNPFFQIFDAPGTKQALAESIEKRKMLDDMERKQADDAAVQLQAKNAGLTGDFHGSRDLVVQNIVQDYLSGDPVRAGRAQAMLNATGHGDLTKALEAQSVEAVLSQFKTRQSIGDELDKATTDKEYQDAKEKLQKKDPDYKIPDTMSEWNTPAQRGARKAAEQSAMLMINRHLSTLAQQGDYTREMKDTDERAYAGVAKNYDNTPITENEGVTHQGLSTHGSRGPEGSKDVRGLGTTWNWATPENIAKADAMGKTQYPEAERTKDEHVLRAIRQIITDPKTGELMTGEELKHHLNTNPNLLAAIKEAFAAEYREGGGATAQLVRMALNERGKVQGWFDEIMAAWAGGKAVITGDAIQKYMTDASQEQIRYVLDMVTRDTLKDAAGRLNNMADFAGMKGFTKEQLPVSPELQDILEERMLKARERNIEALSGQARVVSGNSSVWLGPDNNATKAIPGSFVAPVPRSSLPHLYPELQNPVPPPNPPQPGTIREVPITKPPEKRSEATPEEPGVLSKVASALNPISPAKAEEAPKQPEGPALLGVTSPHMVQAHKDLNMTPQEQSLYERHLVNLNSKGGVDNPDGSRSTLYQATVKRGDKYYNVPQVFDGKILPPKEADARIDQIGWDKFPSYASDKEANDRYAAMHRYMENDTRDYMAKRRAASIAQRAGTSPTVPTPQAPGGEGTEHPPPAAPAPQGSRGGGSFSNGVPSGGFPAVINNNPVARQVFGVAGQTASNVLKGRPNADTVANNVAIVAASSAKSESNYNPEEIHDGGKGYGLFGHNGDRLRGMAASAGVKPFDQIPVNAQTAWYAREMSIQSERDPFISRVLNDPNASAEDLTRVQMRMEQPKGYKEGQEEKGKNWNERLANTQALMAGRPVATAGTGAPAAIPAATAVAAQPSRFSPAGVRESLASRNPQAGGAFKEGLWMAPGMVGNAVGGAIAGPPGAAVVGGLAQAGTNVIRNRMEAPPDQPPSLKSDVIKGGAGFAQGATMAIPGFRPAAIGARVALGGAIPGFEAYMEGKSTGDIYNATTLGMAGSAIGETFGASLGAAQYGIWKILDLKGRAELMSIGKTLATEDRKVMDATGKMVENPTYAAALDRAKQLRQEPDDLAHGWNVINGKTMQEADKGAPLTRTEALATRPGETARYEAQRKLDDIQQAANEAAKPPGAPFRANVVHDPRSLIGNEVPDKQIYKTDAETAFNRMNRKANNWGEVWDNVFQARSDLLTKSRESARIQGPGAKEASEAYQAMADKVFEQQKEIANRLLPPTRAKALIDRLESARNDYREAVLAGGHDIIKTIAGGGANAERAAAAVNKLNANDPEARAVTAALLRLHNHGGIKGGLQGMGGIGTAIYAAMHAPGVGHLVGGVAMGYGLYKSYRTLNALWAARGAGSTAKFGQLVHRAPLRFKLPVGAGAVIGGQIGATQGPGYLGVQ